MDLFTVVRFYIDKMLKEVAGVKVLVLDHDTTQIVSMVYSQSEILEQEVFLVEKLEAHSGEQLFHLKVGTAENHLPKGAPWLTPHSTSQHKPAQANAALGSRLSVFYGRQERI